MSKRMLAFEIGTEEIPALPLYAATRALVDRTTKALDDARILHGAVQTYSTPRRIIVMVQEVAEVSEELTIRAKGPSAQIAFDEAGLPTKAAMGFARGKGVDVSDLLLERDDDGKEYLYAVVESPSAPTRDLLPSILADLIAGIAWPKSQRWGSGHVFFSRPIRWLLALLGDDVIDAEYAGLHADRVTRGHRLMAPQEFTIAKAEDFLGTFDEMRVVVSAQDRAALIREQIAVLEEQTGLKADTPERTFDEVVNLVEYPTVLMGHFDESFLSVPPEIITDAMLEHQRYFPMYRADGTLDNAFLLVGNGDPHHSDIIRAGNERVVRARLSDAAFFVSEDLRHPLEDYVDRLSEVVFQEKLGTVGSKTNRIVRIAQGVCDSCAMQPDTRKAALRAALLCKADLVTNAVVEFTSLQGVMGGHYARYAGEGDAVSLAITDHYRPRFAGDDLARNEAGRIVAIADKLDTICGIFAIGQGPTGSSDPFALRRAAIGILNILFEGPSPELGALIDLSLRVYAEQLEFDVAELTGQVRAFFSTRLEVILRDRGLSDDVVSAVMAIGVFEPVETLARAEALATARQAQPEVFGDLATAYTRAANLARPDLGDEPQKDLLGVAESALLEATDKARKQVSAALEDGNHASAIQSLAALREPIDAFFDEVLIMDEDEALRNNRLRLLNRFVEVFEDVADIGRLSKK